MKTKVWISLFFISSLVCTACVQPKAPAEPISKIPLEQDTLEMVPDFSYAITPQHPHILIDRLGYRGEDKKKVYFYGTDLEEGFVVENAVSGEEVYSGTLHKTKEKDNKELYVGDFSALLQEGRYVIKHPVLGDSYEFVIEDSIYEQEFLAMQKIAKEYAYSGVSEFAYVLANMMFIEQMYGPEKVDASFIGENLIMLLNSYDEKSGAFYNEIMEEPIQPEQNPTGTISLTTTAQMAGVLAQYSILYQEADPVFASRCLATAQKAYRYMEQYKANTDTDAWYYAAVSLYRATNQYKYRNAIAEYDAVDSSLHSSTPQGYMILADFTYLSTPWGTDYNRCNALLKRYMDRAQSISVKSSQENFYVPENIDTMTNKKILEDMIVLGVVNHVLSGQEYAGVQRNYIHYLSGVNTDARNILAEEMIAPIDSVEVNIADITRLMVIFGNLCE